MRNRCPRESRTHSYSPCEIVFLEEGVYWHRQVCPPIRKGKPDSVTFLEISKIAFQFRALAVRLFLLCQINCGIVINRIAFLRNYLISFAR